MLRPSSRWGHLERLHPSLDMPELLIPLLWQNLKLKYTGDVLLHLAGRVTSWKMSDNDHLAGVLLSGSACPVHRNKQEEWIRGLPEGIRNISRFGCKASLPSMPCGLVSRSLFTTVLLSQMQTIPHKGAYVNQDKLRSLSPCVPELFFHPQRLSSPLQQGSFLSEKISRPAPSNAAASVQITFFSLISNFVLWSRWIYCCCVFMGALKGIQTTGVQF